MSELLTTGQMIDRLKPGEVAESKNRKAYYDSNCQLIVESKLTGEKEPFTIWSGDKSPIWRILPKYVSFEEAMKAYAEGKTIRSYYNGESKTYNINDFDVLTINVERIRNGKWTIEE